MTADSLVAFARRGYRGPVGRDAADDRGVLGGGDQARYRHMVIARYLLQRPAHLVSPAP